LEKVRSKREIVTLVVLILRFLKDIQVEMSNRFYIWARYGAQERGMSWTFSFGSYQGVNKSHEIAQRE